MLLMLLASFFNINVYLFCIRYLVFIGIISTSLLLLWFGVNVNNLNYDFVARLTRCYIARSVGAGDGESMNATPVPFLWELRARSCVDPDSMLFRQPRSEQVPWPKTLTLQLGVCETCVFERVC